MRIFEVYEVEYPSLHTTGPSHGAFSNFEAASGYVKDMVTPEYDRYMVIIEVELTNEWPRLTLGKLPTLTYFKQEDGEFVQFNPNKWELSF